MVLRPLDRVLPVGDAGKDVDGGPAGAAASARLVEARHGHAPGRDPGSAFLPDLNRARHHHDPVSARPRHRRGEDTRRRRGLANCHRGHGDPLLPRGDRLAGEPPADLPALGGRSTEGLAVFGMAGHRRRGRVDLGQPWHSRSPRLGQECALRPRLLPPDGATRARLRDHLLHADYVGRRPLQLPADDRRDRPDRRRGDAVVRTVDGVGTAADHRRGGCRARRLRVALVPLCECVGQRGRPLDAHTQDQPRRLAGAQPSWRQEVFPRRHRGRLLPLHPVHQAPARPWRNAQQPRLVPLRQGPSRRGDQGVCRGLPAHAPRAGDAGESRQCAVPGRPLRRSQRCLPVSA